MTWDNDVAKMTPGQALMDVPIPKLIENTAKAIAAAQYELDASAVRAATLLSETKVAFKNDDGSVVDRSLLELGFTPSFYHFTETDMEFNVTISVKVESGVDFGLTVGIGDDVGNGSGGNANNNNGTGGTSSADNSKKAPKNIPAAYGGTISLDVHHKYGFDMSATSKIRTTMKSIPPPQTFIQALQTHAAMGGTIEASDQSNGSTDS
jgi:hypothetical protein